MLVNGGAGVELVEILDRSTGASMRPSSPALDELTFDSWRGTPVRVDPPRAEHPEPCPSPRSPFAVGDQVAIVSSDRWAGSLGVVVTIDRCGIEAHGRHVPIGECAVDVGRARVLWFRFDELAPTEISLATTPERERAGVEALVGPESAGEGPSRLSGDLAGR